MNNIRAIVAALAVTALASCGSGIDPQGDVEQQAVELTSGCTPEQAAVRVVEWMSGADIADRRFARRLTRQIASIYDTMPGDESHRFVVSIDSVRSTMSVSAQARAFAVATTPGRLGRMLRREKADGELVEHIRRAYESDPEALEDFNAAYTGEDEPIPAYLKDDKR